MNELDKLFEYLEVRGYNTQRIQQPIHDRNQVVVKDSNNKYLWDAICQPGSYGFQHGLLEIAGILVDEESDDDTVVGYLTAQDVIERLNRYEGNTLV